MAEKKEVTITRKEIIVVDKVSSNEYGDLVFTSKDGKSFKVKEKRSQYFIDVILEGRAVELSLSEYMKTEYVYSAKLVDLPKDAPEIAPATPQSTPVASKPQTGCIAPQEKGMWWKEVGECFRAGLFKKDDNGAGTYLWKAYVKQMLIAVDVSIEPKKTAPQPETDPDSIPF